MSMVYWSIEGIGLDLTQLVPRLQAKKLADIICLAYHGQNSEEERAAKELQTAVSTILPEGNAPMVEKIISEWASPDAPVSRMASLGELLATLDGVLSFSSDEEGREYLYYSRCYPWDLDATHPQHLDEAVQRVANVLLQATDLTGEEALRAVDPDLYYQAAQ